MDVEARSAWRWPLLISIVILNIILPTLILCYGVIWVRLADVGLPLWLGLTAPTLFLITRGFSQCWFREAADSWGGSVGYRLMAAVGLVVVVSSLLLCMVLPLKVQPIIYGVLGGLGSSLISAQVDAVTFESYHTRIGIVHGLCFSGQAIGLSIFPHILSAIFDHYDYYNSFLLLSGIMLQTLPAIMFLKINVTKKSLYSLRYKELSQTFGLCKKESVDNIYTTDIQLQSLNNKCWKSPSDDNLHIEDELEYDDTNILETTTPPPSPEEKRRNIFGVEILPEIPEESEESDIDDCNAVGNQYHTKNKKRFSLAIRRLSNLGDNLDECILNLGRTDSLIDYEKNELIKDYTEVEVVHQTVEPLTDIQAEKILYTFTFRCQTICSNLKRKFYIRSYRVYRMKRRVFYVLSYLNETFFKPLKRSLSYGKFYPALLLSFTKLVLATLYLALLPMIAWRLQPKMTMLETNFLISLHSFTWICFLLCTPWLAFTPKRNYKYVVVSGLLISTCACFVLARAKTHDSFSIGCVVGGFGFGAIASCWETAVQDFVGARKWPKIQSTLETLSAFSLGVLASGLTLVIGTQHGLQLSMYIIGLILSGITFVWVIIIIISIYTTKVRDFDWKASWR